MVRNPKKVRSIHDVISEYEQDTTIAEYLKLRRSVGVSAVDSQRFFGFDTMIMLDEELRKHAIDPLLVASVLDGNDRKLDELCLQIMERLEARRTLERSGKSHLQSRNEAIPDTLIDYLIVFALEACDHHALVPPSSLVILVRDRLGGSNPSRYEQYVISRKRHMAIAIAISDIERGLDVSIRRVAKEMAVQPSTVKRWFADTKFEDYVKRFKSARDGVRLTAQELALRKKQDAQRS